MYKMDYEEHLHWNTPSLTIAFSGGDQSRFHFARTLNRLQVDHVLMKDSRFQWYQNGIVGLDSREQLIAYIKNLIVKPYKVTTIGLSSGSYAALLYGQLSRVDRVIAISPVTGTEKEAFAPAWHHRFVRYPGDPDVVDLLDIFKNKPIPYCKAFVADGNDCALDWYMATRIGISDITLVPGYDHGTLARGMRDSGLLDALLK